MRNSRLIKGVSIPLRVFICIAALLYSLPALAASPSMRVTFVNPDEKGDLFWDNVTLFMQEVAKDLHIELEVLYTNKDRFKSYQLLREALQRENKPDYLLYIYQAGTGKRILDLAESHGVPSFLFNTAIHPKEQAIVGEPRGRYKYWIGHMYPDDTYAGEILARSLLSQAHAVRVRTSQANAPEQPMPVIGISGGLDSAVSGHRNLGLEKAISEFGSAELKQLVYAQWEPDVALKQANVLRGRYPQAKVFWVASDTMALALANEFNSQGGYYIGGIDWTRKGLEAVQAGKLSASVGGHFMEGGWSLLLMHDYHLGKDFAAKGLSFKTKMQLIDKNNVNEYYKRIYHDDFKNIDFREFSKAYYPDRPYDFNFDSIIRAQR